MSAVAIQSMFRLQCNPRLTGYMIAVLLYLCWRADERTDVAHPGLDRAARDLGLTKSSVARALDNLRKTGLISKTTGGGRNRASAYKLEFVARHRIDPKSDAPIVVGHKLFGQRDSKNLIGRSNSKCVKTVRPEMENCSAGGTKTVRPVEQCKRENIEKGADGERGKHAAGALKRPAIDAMLEKYRGRPAVPKLENAPQLPCRSCELAERCRAESRMCGAARESIITGVLRMRDPAVHGEPSEELHQSTWYEIIDLLEEAA